MPVRAIDPLTYPKASRTKIAKVWTRLAQGFLESQDRFSQDENVAADAILMQIQGALVALGFVPIGKASSRHEYIPQLVPNTRALAKFLERKRRENPRVGVFPKLARAAKSLAEQINVATPVIPASSIKGSSAIVH